MHSNQGSNPEHPRNFRFGDLPGRGSRTRRAGDLKERAVILIQGDSLGKRAVGIGSLEALLARLAALEGAPRIPR